ncbi:hypothetical protein C0992_004770 [Termitomyces sp. T32_za158]|nr:hypothetical protein C0992_004770 [Termitomyces sp. T32_za158]
MARCLKYNSWRVSHRGQTLMLKFLYYLGAVSLLPTNVLGLWPIPRNLELGTTFLKLAPTFDIEIDFNNAPQDLLDAVSRTKGYLQTDKLQRLVVGRGEKDSAAVGQALELSSLSISLTSNTEPRPIATEATLPLETRSEGYSLDVPSDGSPATLTANSTLGLFRGLTTFSQLWYDLAGVTYTYQTPVKIVNDHPAFVSRKLEALCLTSLRLRHISSSRIEEIDTPGHTAAIADSHPEHIACNQALPWSQFANEPPAGQLRLASSATANFTAEFISAIAQTLPSTLFSTGGDELNTNCYAKDAQTQADLSSSGRTLEQALSSFVQSTHKPLIDLGKTPVVWEEMVLEHEVALPETAVIMWVLLDLTV